jgi:hypothetical protein
LYPYAASRRRAAIHEAGHIVAARYVGDLSAWGYIEPSEARFGEHLHRHWVGQAEAGYHTLKRRDNRLIRVAGAVAEYVWDDREGDEPWFDTIYENMSDTDRRFYDYNFRRVELDCNDSAVREETAWFNAMLRAYKLFTRHGGPLWPALCKQARHMIEATRPTGPDARRQPAAQA